MNNCLKNANIRPIRDSCSQRAGAAATKNFGKKSLNEIKDIHGMGLISGWSLTSRGTRFRHRRADATSRLRGRRGREDDE